MPRCTVGSRQAKHELHRESIEEDDMVMRVGNSLGRRERDKPIGEEEAASPRSL